MTDIDQTKALMRLCSMLQTVRAYDKKLVKILLDYHDRDKKITVAQISNLYGYAEAIASEQRQAERELNKQVGLVPKVGRVLDKSLPGDIGYNPLD